jgi:hypothetical protein
MCRKAAQVRAQSVPYARCNAAARKFQRIRWRKLYSPRRTRTRADGLVDGSEDWRVTDLVFWLRCALLAFPFALLVMTLRPVRRS